MPISFSKLGNYGHLGNSLFQAACTIALAKRNNDSFILSPTWKYKDKFNLPQSCFQNIKPKTTYQEPGFHYCEISYKPNMDLEGYFQSEKYFKDFEKDIKELFAPKFTVGNNKDCASIHVRRGDYVTLPNHHPVLTMDYYNKAIQLIEPNATKFLVFSDDIKWCKENFIGNKFEFVEGNAPEVDLILQAKCSHNIIANSSFSWWGAYLNENPNKIVIAPKKWFGQTLSMHNTKDLYCADWILA